MSSGSLVSPLRESRTFRVMWLAQSGIQVGIWVQTVTAQWLTVAAGESATVVGLVTAMSSLPMLFLGVFAGVLADALPRRAIIATASGLAGMASIALVVLELAGSLTTPLLLLLLGFLGAVQATNYPAWSASVPDLVSRANVQSASMLASIGVNMGRVVGPAVAGVLISFPGPGFAFLVSALGYFSLALTTITVGSFSTGGQRQRFTAAFAAGARHVRYAPGFLQALALGAMWFLSGSAFWALLPVVALRTLGLDSTGFGTVYAVIGAGAVFGTALVAPLRLRLAPRRYLALMVSIHVAAVLGFALSGIVWITYMLLPLLGMTWTTIGSSLAASAQLLLPTWVRARGLAWYMTCTQGGLGLGSVLWGGVADLIGTTEALAVSGLSLVLFLGLLALRPSAEQSLSLSGRPWGAPMAPAVEVEGRVLVICRYVVEPTLEEDFREVMKDVRRSRLRTGASSWRLYLDPAGDGVFVEVFSSPSWADHLHQHQRRQTVADQRVSDRLRGVATRLESATHLIEAP